WRAKETGPGEDRRGVAHDALTNISSSPQPKRHQGRVWVADLVRHRGERGIKCSKTRWDPNPGKPLVPCGFMVRFAGSFSASGWPKAKRLIILASGSGVPLPTSNLIDSFSLRESRGIGRTSPCQPGVVSHEWAGVSRPTIRTRTFSGSSGTKACLSHVSISRKTS